MTGLFCDVTGSTGLGERLDAESLRHVMARYFEVMRLVVERHGGTVEKFIGDAVMAVFGVPLLHEDDALRGVRAAAGMREALQGLNVELGRDYGIGLEARTGVNTGEVVAGTEERLVTGDAVNVAARLQQAASPGEVLLGEGTLRLVRHAVEVEAVGPFELKGKSEPLSAYRLRAVSEVAETVARRLDGQMVGREREQRLLADAWERVCSERACHLFTLLGTAGVGKSRLAREFLGGIEATVLRGRCLAYGEGISYWPVVEVVKQLLGAEPLERLGEFLSDPVALAAIGSLLGESGQPTSPEEIAWSVRKLLEAAAAERSLVVVFDDVQWGEQTFLDLVEHVADLSRGAPILLLCMGRPELLDHRPGWGSGTMNANRVLLEPLSGEETDDLIELLLGEQEITGSLRERILRQAEGNPLFVEEILLMLRDSNGEGDGEVVVPPTIQALLAARLDQLDPAERKVLERASVEGYVFHQGAVEVLAPEEPDIRARLVALVRRQLVQPEIATLPGEDAYRFRHLLIRDSAYDSLPKATRAELHERYAQWLDGRGTDLVERDEIVGYHLEQAYRYHAELGSLDAHANELARLAADRLQTAGRKAWTNRDARATVNLLERALALGPDDAPVAVSLDLSEALGASGKLDAATRVANDAAERAAAAGDRPTELRSRLAALRVGDWESGTGEELAALAQEGLRVFAEAADDDGLIDAYRAIASVESAALLGSAAKALETAL